MSGLLCFIDFIHSSELKTRYEQLRMELEQANKMVRAAESELNELKTAAQEQKAKEERLQRQLLENKEKIFHLEQGQDAEKRLERNKIYCVWYILWYDTAIGMGTLPIISWHICITKVSLLNCWFVIHSMQIWHDTRLLLHCVLSQLMYWIWTLPCIC